LDHNDTSEKPDIYSHPITFIRDSSGYYPSKLPHSVTDGSYDNILLIYDTKGLSEFNQMDDIYNSINNLFDALNDPNNKDILDQIPTESQAGSTSSSSTTAIDPNKAKIKFEDSIYDPQCDPATSSQCKVVNNPNNNPFKEASSTNTADDPKKNKKNLDWLWVVLGVIGGVLLISLGILIYAAVKLGWCSSDQNSSKRSMDDETLEMDTIHGRPHPDAHLDLR